MTLPNHKTVVVDTNLFLHYKRLDYLDWSALKCANIELVVPAIVIRELEKAKNFGSSPRLKTRAAETVTWLSKLMDQGFELELKKGLRLKFETVEPAINFAEHSLVRELQDDVLIAGLLGQVNTTSERPVMATADLGLKSKARQRGFEVFAPLEIDKLVEEQDPRDKELSDLRKENQQYKNRQPRLNITFIDGETHLKFQPPEATAMPLGLAEMKRELPFMDSSRDAPKESPVLPRVMLSLYTISESQREAYNERLQKFYGEYESYLYRVQRCRELALCRVQLALSLANGGTAPGTDIDVIFTFPKGTLVLKDLEQVEVPKAPSPPKKPVPSFIGDSMIGSQAYRASPLSEHLLAPHLLQRRASDFSLEVTENTAHFKLESLKPGFERNLPVFWLQFSGGAEFRSTPIQVEVSAAESLGLATHQLHIIIP